MSEKFVLAELDRITDSHVTGELRCDARWNMWKKLRHFFGKVGPKSIDQDWLKLQIIRFIPYTSKGEVTIQAACSDLDSSARCLGEII